MLNTVIILSKSAPGIIWGIYVDALDLTVEFALKSFQGK